MKRSQGSKNPFFVNRLDLFFRDRNFFRHCHESDYSHVAVPGQPNPVHNARHQIGQLF
jgi:hypothetical protein